MTEVFGAVTLAAGLLAPEVAPPPSHGESVAPALDGEGAAGLASAAADAERTACAVSPPYCRVA